MDLFFEAMSAASPTIVGMIGSGCSVASLPVAEIVHHFSLSQVRK